MFCSCFCRLIANSHAPVLLTFSYIILNKLYLLESQFHSRNSGNLLHFVVFFHVASLLTTRVDNKKVGVDNEKALELDNKIFFFIFQPNFNTEISPKNATKKFCCIVA